MRINEDYLDDLVQDAILPEDKVEDNGLYHFAILLDGNKASQHLPFVLSILRRFPDVYDYIVKDPQPTESSNIVVFESEIPLEFLWQAKKCIFFNASFRTSTSMMNFFRFLDTYRKKNYAAMHFMSLKRNWTSDFKNPWREDEILRDRLSDFVLNHPWHQRYPYTLNDMLQSPEFHKKNICMTIRLWLDVLDRKPDDAFLSCDDNMAIMQCIALTEMGRRFIAQSNKYLTVDDNALKGAIVSDDMNTGAYIINLDTYTNRDLDDADLPELTVKRNYFVIVNANPVVCIAVIAYCGTDIDGCPLVVFNKFIITRKTDEYIEECKKDVHDKICKMFYLNDSEADEILKDVWKKADL